MMVQEEQQDAVSMPAPPSSRAMGAANAGTAAMVTYEPMPMMTALGPVVPQAHVMAPPPELPEPSITAAVLRNFWLVLLFAVVGAGGAWLFLKHARPLFTSESKIYIEPAGPRVLSDVLGSAQRSNYLYTQAEVIKSAPILALVSQMPEMRSLPTFELTNGDVVAYLREQLEAEVGRKDDIITIGVTSPYADDAAKIANAVVQAYTNFQSVEKKTSTSHLLDTLKRTKDESDKEVGAVQTQIDEFKRKNPNLNIDSMYQQDLARTLEAYTQAQLATIEAKAGNLPGNPLLRRAQQREEDLYEVYQKKLRQVMDLNVNAADFAQLASKLAQKKEFNRQLENRINELQVNKDAEQIFNTVQVLEAARMADGASFPRPKRTMAVAIIAGALLGAGLALLRDRLDGRMRSVEEIQTVIGLPILGVVPAMSGRRTAVARAMTVHLDPRSVVAESYRTVRTAVYFGANGSRCKTILITSPEPGDGKTTSASNLAIAIAQTGRSVLLLDADFRKPTQHKNLDIKDSVGLSSVLAGRESLERAIQRTGVEGLDILPCGPIPANPSEILNSREFGELIDTLAARYEHILFDSPPVNAVTDARILGAVCDATILVLRADKSTKKAGEHARNALLTVGARVLGAIVNDAPNRKGYEVYGGSYYGNVDVSTRHADTYVAPPVSRRLTSGIDEVDD
jgi:capsular exopolysaccharide synthesis family protein